MDTTRIHDHDDSEALDAHYSCLERSHACMDGIVFIGHLVEDESGEEVEEIEAVPCRRCAGDSRHEAAEVL